MMISPNAFEIPEDGVEMLSRKSGEIEDGDDWLVGAVGAVGAVDACAVGASCACPVLVRVAPQFAGAEPWRIPRPNSTPLFFSVCSAARCAGCCSSHHRHSLAQTAHSPTCSQQLLVAQGHPSAATGARGPIEPAPAGIVLPPCFPCFHLAWDRIGAWKRSEGEGSLSLLAAHR